MECCYSVLNSKGFQSSISTGYLPQPDHITYEGAFNQLSFTLGKKATKQMELHIGYSRSQNIHSSFDSKINDYLAIFTKSSKDGEDRDQRRLNSVICLDISGSMSSALTRNGQGNRLQLAKQAIKMFFSKLKDTDAFSLIVFDDKSQTVIPCKMKKQHNQQQLLAILQKIKTRGGTTLITGFKQAQLQLTNFFKSQNYSKQHSTYQNRIIMLTDVNDNSVANSKKFIQNVNKTQNIHTTIIGISDDFRSQTCQELIQVQGFNYFCATEQSDLKKYLFQNFNFTFFPSNNDIEIQIVDNKNIKSFEVFGTVDKKRIKEYNNNFEEIRQNLIITKTNTSFPSELEFAKDGNIKQYGGLIIIKLNLQTPIVNKFTGLIKLSYKNPITQKKQGSLYPIQFSFPQNEQFYSEQCLAQAMSVFYYVYQVRNILQKINKCKKQSQKKQFAGNLQKLKGICPESKLKQLEDMIKILKNNNLLDPQNQNYN